MQAICRRKRKLAVYDINNGAAIAVSKNISKAGGSARAYAVDLTDLNRLPEIVAVTKRELGPIDILVNNAGWDRFMPFLKTTPDFLEQDHRDQPQRRFSMQCAQCCRAWWIVDKAESLRCRLTPVGSDRREKPSTPHARKD